MKYLKKYNEDIEWEFDNEEDKPSEFKINDRVILKGDYYSKLIGYYDDWKDPSNYYIKTDDYKYKNELFIIKQIRRRNDGELVFLLKNIYTNRVDTWFETKYWKKYTKKYKF